MKYLCLDLGTAHTGIAVSEEGVLATPLATIFERDEDVLIGKIISIIAQNNPDFLIVGVPEHGPLVKYANHIGEKLKEYFEGEIIYFEEDLSSKKAQKTLDRTSKSHQQKKQIEHQTAAAHILQDYLDSL